MQAKLKSKFCFRKMLKNNDTKVGKNFLFQYNRLE